MPGIHANTGRRLGRKMPGMPVEGSTRLTHASGLACLPDCSYSLAIPLFLAKCPTQDRARRVGCLAWQLSPV